MGKPRIAILASGTGTNFDAIQAKIASGDLPAEIAVVVSDNAEAGVLAKAKKLSIPAVVVNEPAATRDSSILKILRQYSATGIVLTGYLKLIREPLLGAYKNKILNIHPGPLPRFGGKNMYGRAVHEAVIKAGVKESGPTVHIVDAKFDHGKILGHTPVPVMPGDTPERLFERELPAEHDLYWRVIKDYFCK